MYSVAFSNRTAYAETLADAKHIVREEAIKRLESAAAGQSVVFIRIDEGSYSDVYAYASEDDAESDETGVLALAVISHD